MFWLEEIKPPVNVTGLTVAITVLPHYFYTRLMDILVCAYTIDHASSEGGCFYFKKHKFVG